MRAGSVTQLFTQPASRSYARDLFLRGSVSAPRTQLTASQFNGSKMASCEKAFSFPAAIQTHGSTRLSVDASFLVSSSAADSSPARLIPRFRFASFVRTAALKSPLQAISPLAFRRLVSFPPLRQQQASSRLELPATPQRTRTTITTEWSFTPATGQSRPSPSTKLSHASSTTSCGFHPAQPIWTMRCSCAALRTSGVVGLTFTCLPRVLI